MDGKEGFRSLNNIDSDEEIVISGIAGRFPDSDNMNHLRENLFNKIDLVKSDHGRWEKEQLDLPTRIGIINNLEKFDADFFGLSFKQAHTLLPEGRMLLEHSYEAIIDAGINPKQLRGKNTAVIIGTSYIEAQGKLLYENYQLDSFQIVGCSKSTVANMISYCLDLKGPSYTVDTACSSSLYAMALGYHCIMSGKCEDAIIGAGNLCLHPILTLQFARLGVLSPEGYCRPFDSAGNGYSRSEAIVVIYLQKAKNAKRIYAICPHIKLNSDGYKEEGITHPSLLMQSALLKECYKECGIPTTCLDYIEAHGTGTKVGDPQEVKAIYNSLCKNRKTPLMIGSVKSNLGHGEPASAFIQIAKTIIAFETGFVPPNINFTSPRKNIDALLNGSVCVVQEPMPIKNGYIGINSFGFGGANAHMLLKWNRKQKVNNGTPNNDLPRLVILSGRTEESVKLFLNDIANRPIDVEYIRLLHDVYADNIDNHSWRGYAVLNTLQQDVVKEIKNCNNLKRPVCFVFSALGSQWPGMGRNLLKFHVFAKTISKCDNILKPYGINIKDILTNTEEKVHENALNAFLGIIVIQVGLVDLLTSLGIIPDYMISHSGGELGCAYADKCLTIEQTILSAYFVGLACAKGKIIHSSMVVVRIDYDSLKNICPADIQIVCRNNENNSIVSGPTESIKEFIKKLQTNNIYVKEIYCNVPYHSSYLASTETQLLLNLKKIIPWPKKRSQKWFSTSIPRIEWVNSTSKLSSADYHLRSILNTVLFEQTLHLIPSNAITIELAPCGVLQHILKESLHPEVTNIVLTQRTEQNNNVTFQGIGRLYNSGLQPQVANLYPSVEYPVSRGTAMISPSIRWDHSKDWFIPKYETQKSIKCRERYVEILLNNEDYDYMNGHVVDGHNVLPATSYLALVWQTVGMIKGQIYTTISIVFQDVNFIRATHLSKNEAVNLKIAIQKDGKFEITEGNSVIVTGIVYETLNPEQEMISTDLLPKNNDEEELMTAHDIYKELKLRGYHYSDWFRGLKSASLSGEKGHTIWRNNWVTFMDSMLQMKYIEYDTRDLYIPTSIQKIVINPMLHALKIQGKKDDEEVTTDVDKSIPIRIYKDIDTIKAGGIEIRGLRSTQIYRRNLTQDAVLEEYTFVAHCDRAKIPLNEAIRISAQLALEDHQIINVKAVELVEDEDNVALEYLSSSLLLEAFNDMPLIQTSVTLLTSPNRFRPKDLLQNFSIEDFEKPSLDDKALIAAGFNLLTKQQTSLKRLLPFLREGGYLLTRERYDVIDYTKYLHQYQLDVVLEKCTDKEIIVLLKKKVLIKKRIIVYISNDNFNWLENLKPLVTNENNLDKNSRIIIVGEKDLECGLLGFINCLKKEPGGELVRGVLIQDEEAPEFSLQNPFYVDQLEKDMTINVLRSNKTWGSYRHLKLPQPEASPVLSAHLCQSVRADLSTLCWVENNRSAEARREDLVNIVCSSLNFKDILLTTGKLTSNQMPLKGRLYQYCPLGMEYVGWDANGQRVMGIRETDCIANVIVKDKNLCWEIPDTWTFEEAATVPCAYITVYMALYIYGRMKKGDKILIHSGTGAVGQAAIHVALKEGCEVFTTVGTSNKRDFIRKTFPNILDDHIGNSRDTSFEQMIMQQTKGRGVDVVLNSLAEEKLIVSVRCLAQNGYFLELGKFDFISNNSLSMSEFQKGISFYGILIDNLISNKKHKYKSLLSNMITDGLKNGTIKPIQATAFSKTTIKEAFRYMASGKHIGKVIINIHEKSEPLDKHILAYRRYYCLRNRSYIILGGLGGFGLELTDWLILRGAKNVVLISRTGIKNGYQRMKVQLWKSYGVKVLIIKNIDVANIKDCERLLRTVEKEAPVDAIFNLGVVLKDSLLKNQTETTFAESFLSKARASQTFDKLSRKICLNLRHFVMFSSVSCGRGNAGQTNYGMANSIMERICEKRMKEGLPGLAIQWGAVSEVGLVADMQEDDKELIISGTLQQKISCCLDELDKFLLQSRPIVSSMIVANKKTKSSEFGNLVETVANILDIRDMRFVSQISSLAELGMDSMMAVDIRQTLQRKFDILLTTQEIRNLTFAKLTEMSTNISDNNMHNKKKFNTEKPQFSLAYLILGIKNEDYISQTCSTFSTKGTTTEVFLIPGIEGCGTTFNYLAPKILFSTTSFHYNTSNIDAPTNIISEKTDHLMKYIIPKLKNGKDFIMVGFSFGSLIAIELTRRLETMNFKGRLILIDGAPELIRMIYKCYMPSSELDLQIYVLTHIMEIYSPGNSKKILMELNHCETWDERYNIFAQQFLIMNTSLSLANLKTLCTTIYKHLAAVRQYNPSTLTPIKSSITLLKPTQPLNIPIEEDYCLHKVTHNKVKVHYIEGNHVTILRNEKVSAVINGKPPFII